MFAKVRTSSVSLIMLISVKSLPTYTWILILAGNTIKWGYIPFVMNKTQLLSDGRNVCKYFPQLLTRLVSGHICIWGDKNWCQTNGQELSGSNLISLECGHHQYSCHIVAGHLTHCSIQTFLAVINTAFAIAILQFSITISIPKIYCLYLKYIFPLWLYYQQNMTMKEQQRNTNKSFDDIDIHYISRLYVTVCHINLHTFV